MSISLNELEEATQEAISNSELKKKRNFVESIDVVINLKNVNLKDPSNRFNNEFELPNPIAVNPQICFFIDGDQLVEAKNLGVDAVSKERMEELGKSDKLEKKRFVKKYDFFISSNDLMRFVAKDFGKLLGPRGKMPRPMPQGYGVIKPGDSIEPVIERYKKVIRLKLTKFPLIQFKIGDKNMDIKSLSENFKAVYDFVEQKMEKGRQNIRSVYVKTTMGKPVKIGGGS